MKRHKHYYIATGNASRCRECGKDGKRIDSYDLEELRPEWRANNYVQVGEFDKRALDSVITSTILSPRLNKKLKKSISKRMILTQDMVNDSIDEQDQIATRLFEDMWTVGLKEICKWILFGGASLAFGVGIGYIMVYFLK